MEGNLHQLSEYLGVFWIHFQSLSWSSLCRTIPAVWKLCNCWTRRGLKVNKIM